MRRQLTALFAISVVLSCAACAFNEKPSSEESAAGDGRVSAYGNIRDLGEKGGNRFLSIDYVEWISQEECKRRLKAGTLDPVETECDIDYHIVNESKRLRELGVADPVEILIQRPSRFPETMSWDELSRIWRFRDEEARELWDGLWQIRRRDGLVERIEWVYLP